MNILQHVEYPLREVLLSWKQIGDMLGEVDAMLLPELFNETDQSASERAEGRGRRTLLLHVSPVNLDAHVIVAPGISGMRQGVASKLTSPVPFIQIRGRGSGCASFSRVYVTKSFCALSAKGRTAISSTLTNCS